MIISASRRTDIPSFYSKWFYNRIAEGNVLVRNPMNIHQVSKINLLPNVVDCIVFWTKNPSPFMQDLDKLSSYKYYFQYTFNNYEKNLEPRLPNFEITVKNFNYIANKIGTKRLIWRYDPIIITDKMTSDWHINNFYKICKTISIYTQKCVISFADYYKKTIKNMKHIKYKEATHEEIIQLSKELKKIADNYGLIVESCAEKIDLSQIGIAHGKCIDDKLIQEIINSELRIDKDKNQRGECGCIASIDIGAYNTCSHGCKYCYATFNHDLVRQNYRNHDYRSPLLIGNINIDDKINERKVSSCKIVQQELFN